MISPQNLYRIYRMYTVKMSCNINVLSVVQIPQVFFPENLSDSEYIN